MYRSLIKPFFDRLSALMVLVVLSPVLVVVVMLLFIANKGKVWFVQARPGKDEMIFKVIKFRTMNDERNMQGELLPDNQRLTRIGKFIRKTSLDELPQLINVVKGDMSVVGPRPLLIEYLPLYSSEQKRRHDVKPGITGWAQVNGRNTVAWPQRFAYDVYYVDHQSFWFDVKILLLTVKKVFKAEGISSGTSVTMEKFTGG
jgi:undecaprenyl phosphate N,N'-diacetylbacillosamine 1-phosphate transferase